MSFPKPSVAVTRRINPPGVEPKLTVEQVWKGLSIKARAPMSFVPSIFGCRVEVDTPDKVVRHSTVKIAGKNSEITENVYLYEPTIVYFDSGDDGSGIRVTNMISYDSDGELLLTYSFCNGVPQHTTIEDPVAVSRTFGKVVEHSIQRIRELLADGTIT